MTTITCSAARATTSSRATRAPTRWTAAAATTWSAGGRGDGDLVAGGAGDDVFRYGRGDGRDTFIDAFAGTWETVMSHNAATGALTYVNGYSRDASNRILKGADIIFDGTAWTERVQFDVQTQILQRLVARRERGARRRFRAAIWRAAATRSNSASASTCRISMLAQSGYDLVIGIGTEEAEYRPSPPSTT